MPTPAKRDAADVMADPTSFGTTLTAALIDTFTTEALAWDPITTHALVKSTLGVDLNASQLGKLMSVITVITTDRFYENLPDFVELVNAMNGHGLDPGVFSPNEAEEVAWAVSEALLVGPPENGDEPFREEIRRYIGKILDREGIMTPPDVLAIALRDDKGRAARVAAQFADDPEMMHTIRIVEDAKTQEITNAVKDGLARLKTQLLTLNTTTEDASAFAGKYDRTH